MQHTITVKNGEKQTIESRGVQTKLRNKLYSHQPATFPKCRYRPTNSRYGPNRGYHVSLRKVPCWTVRPITLATEFPDAAETSTKLGCTPYSHGIDDEMKQFTRTFSSVSVAVSGFFLDLLSPDELAILRCPHHSDKPSTLIDKHLYPWDMFGIERAVARLYNSVLQTGD